MFQKIKKSSWYMAFASLVLFSKLMIHSIYVNVTGQNTRSVTDKMAHQFGKEMLAAVSATLQVNGKLPEIVPGRSYMLISTHSSHFDIPAVFAGIPLSVRMLAKKELFRIPFFGMALGKHEFIKIDRQDRTKALKALEQAKKLMESGIVVWAAAEGTRSRTGDLLPFKKGLFMLAIDAQAIIIPLTIKGTRDILPAKTWKFSADKKVTVTIGDPIDTKGMTHEARNQLMTEVRAQMTKALIS